MKIKETLDNYEARLKKVETLATKAATNTEKYYWEVRELKENIGQLVKISQELVEAISALLKIQIGD